MRKRPKRDQIYKHFKGTYYQIVDIAKHSETGEELVIYRNLFEPEEVYARPLNMFLSEVDRDKYPEVTQQYRFALSTGKKKQIIKKSNIVEYEEDELGDNTSNNGSGSSDKYETDDDMVNEASDEVTDNEEYENAQQEESEIGALLERFLDAKQHSDKLDIFMDMRGKVTEAIMGTISAALELELSKPTVEEQYDEILECLRTLAKYECMRLR